MSARSFNVRGSRGSMRNIEVKVRCPDLATVRDRIQALGAAYQWTRRQIDTYFRVEHGRFKLRQESDEPGATLIAYQRADEAASRYSDYRMLAVSDGEQAREMLSDALGTLAVVNKRRELYLLQQTRIHLDEVDALGQFVELETVVETLTPDGARDQHEHVRAALGLNEYDVVSVSYSDLILRQG